MVAVDIWQARQASNAGGISPDFQPSPYRMGNTLMARVRGLLASTTTLYYPATYTVTVGGGGASGAINSGGFGQNPGGNGSNSIISGTGLSTITSTGGGGGGAGDQGPSGSNVGKDGGSGGGGNRFFAYSGQLTILA